MVDFRVVGCGETRRGRGGKVFGFALAVGAGWAGGGRFVEVVAVGALWGGGGSHGEGAGHAGGG